MAKTMQRAGRRVAITEPSRNGNKGSPVQMVALDVVKPPEIVTDMLDAAETKARLPVRDMLIRGFLAGAFLGFATALAQLARVQNLPPLVGALLFPVGFVMLVLLGFELATGNFAVLPAGVAAGRVTVPQMLRNWTWVYVGNLIGSVFFGALFFVAVTSLGDAPAGPIGDAITTTALAKTTAYQALGASGWVVAITKAILCNWMVTVGVVMALTSRSTIGKIVAMWLPIVTFFALGFEHSIVNMFVMPTAMMFGADVSVGRWLLWNQIPVTIGNVVGGAVFTGLALFYTYKPSPASR